MNRRKYVNNYQDDISACEVIISFVFCGEEIDYMKLEQHLRSYGNVIKESLRKNDVMKRRDNGFYILFPEIHKNIMDKVIGRIKESLINIDCMDEVEISIDSHMVYSENELPTWMKRVV
ncbi:MAG: hypothetical protein K6F55_04535 [Eubacterium sp.]|nr:hypothetical protein [Eubacterium sp.]